MRSGRQGKIEGERKRGAQPGNRNALKGGLHTAEMRTLRREARQRIRSVRTAIARANLVLRAQFLESVKNEAVRSKTRSIP